MSPIHLGDARRRKTFIAAAAAILAGSGFMYAYSSNKRNLIAASKSSHGDKEKQKALSTRRQRQKGMKALRKLSKILISKMGTNGFKTLLSLAVTAVLRTALSNRLARVQGFLFRAAFLRRLPLFCRLIGENLLLCLLQSTVYSTTRFLTGMLSLQMRKTLTDYVHADYFQNMTYYKISHVDKRIQNPEQRITSDIPRFSAELSEVIQENLSAVFDGIVYTWRLYSYASPKYAAWILAYLLGAGFVTRRASPAFGSLLAKEQHLEGDYKQIHARLRTHSESIALYGGHDREAAIVKQRFNKVIEHLRKVVHTYWWFGMIQDFTLKYLGATVGLVLIIEPFFNGKLRPGHSTLGKAEMLSNIRYHTSVITSLFHSYGALVFSLHKLNRISGYADRLWELMQVAEELRSADNSVNGSDQVSGGHFVEANHIEFKDVKIATPNGNTLVENLTLRLERGHNLLIIGPNGSGKSSLFRVLGGLWPLVSGCIRKPGVGSSLNKDIFYVPQRPYTAMGTLRDQLIYPLTAAQEVTPLNAEEMRQLLSTVDLEYLLDRYPVEAEVNWGDELSLGEQQRLGMARLFYHKPSFAILDECTSAVTTDMEQRFCAKVRDMGTSCITISHRPALVAFHDIVLALDGEGSAALHYKGDEAMLPSKEPHYRERNSQRETTAVQDVFSGAHEDGESRANSHIEALVARSCGQGICEPLPLVQRLRSDPRSITTRVTALSNIVVPSLRSKQGGQLLAVALLMVARTLISDRIANLNGRSVKYVLDQDKAAFMRLIGLSVLQSGASAMVAPSLRYLIGVLGLEWRKRTTEHLLKLYFKKNAYYKVFHVSETKIDADQRITQDVERLGFELSGLVTGMVKPSMDIFWFTWRMQMLTGRRGILILYTYMFLGLGLLRLITPDFGALAGQEQLLEGSFRFLHSRLHTHAESIAFFGGDMRERAIIEDKFTALMEHSKSLLMKRWIFGIADGFITKELPHNVTWGLSLLYAMDNYSAGASSAKQGDLAHSLRFLASVVSQSFMAFGDLLELHRKFNNLSGGINRIMELNELLESAQQGEVNQDSLYSEDEQRSDDIMFSDVDVITPAQKILAKKLTFRVSPGKSLLVTGPNGAGKSSLFRALGGLWPCPRGRIVKPTMDGKSQLGLSREIFYVPQRPYTALGTLRDQIIYPMKLDEAIFNVAQADGGIKGAVLSDRVKAMELLDRRLLSILEEVRLVYLLEREGGWDSVANWEDMLSLGEQQRLGMARLFFHRPKYGVLDECTNATSADVEEHLYRIATRMGITIVTISQRPALIPFHCMELHLVDGEGSWELRQIKSPQC